MQCCHLLTTHDRSCRYGCALPRAQVLPSLCHSLSSTHTDGWFTTSYSYPCRVQQAVAVFEPTCFLICCHTFVVLETVPIRNFSLCAFLNLIQGLHLQASFACTTIDCDTILCRRDRKSKHTATGLVDASCRKHQVPSAPRHATHLFVTCQTEH